MCNDLGSQKLLVFLKRNLNIIETQPRNIIFFLGFTIEDDIPTLVMEWAENGVIMAYLEKKPYGTDIRQLVSDFLHSRTML